VHERRNELPETEARKARGSAERILRDKKVSAGEQKKLVEIMTSGEDI